MDDSYGVHAMQHVPLRAFAVASVIEFPTEIESVRLRDRPKRRFVSWQTRNMLRNFLFQKNRAGPFTGYPKDVRSSRETAPRLKYSRLFYLDRLPVPSDKQHLNSPRILLLRLLCRSSDI